MQLKLVQKKSGVSAAFEIYLGAQLVGQALQSNNLTFGGSWSLSYAGRMLSMDYRRAELLGNLTKGAGDKVFMPYQIHNEAGEELGMIVRKFTGGSIFTRYEYVEMSCLGRMYRMYVVGLGKAGYAFPIYCGETQVALIEKGCEVRNNLDEYELFCMDGFDLPGVMLGLYLDTMMFANRGEVSTHSVKKSVTITTNKEIKAKYDPQFKDRMM